MTQKYFQKDEIKFGVFKLKILYLHPLYGGRAVQSRGFEGGKKNISKKFAQELEKIKR